MNITKAQYATDLDGNVNSVRATINGEVWVVPLDPDNTDYAEILKQVKEGTLTIKEAE
jgi:hypothetical protein